MEISYFKTAQSHFLSGKKLILEAYLGRVQLFHIYSKKLDSISYLRKILIDTLNLVSKNES